MTQPHTTNATMNSTQGIGFFAALILNKLRNERAIQEHQRDDSERDDKNDPAQQAGDEVGLFSNKRLGL